MQARIYHNPRCSKSRAALALLQARDLELEIVEYLRHPPRRATLQALRRKLGVAARDLVRTNEPEAKAAGLPADAADKVWIDLLVAHPQLLQRPIVEIGARAVIGRPPERVLELLE